MPKKKKKSSSSKSTKPPPPSGGVPCQAVHGLAQDPALISPLVQACAMIFCATYIVLIFIADMASILSNPRLRHPK